MALTQEKEPRNKPTHMSKFDLWLIRHFRPGWIENKYSINISGTNKYIKWNEIPISRHTQQINSREIKALPKYERQHLKIIRNKDIRWVLYELRVWIS